MSFNDGNAVFEPRRFGFLLKLEALKGWRPLLVVSGSVMGVFLLVSLIMGYGREHFDHISSFSNLLYIGGFIFTGRVFLTFYKKEWNIPTLMLPASLFEKGLTQLLLSTIGWVVYSLLVYTLFSLVSSGLNLLIWDFATPVFTPSRLMGKIIIHYLVIQSLFFLGASLFRKAAFFKTILSMVGLVTLLSLIFALLVKLFFWREMGFLFESGRHFEGTFFSGDFHYEGDFRGWFTLAKVFYYGVMPLFCWTTAFLRLREIEVKDGV